jgi:hypothetical protein
MDADIAQAYWNLESDALPWPKLVEQRRLERMDFVRVGGKFSRA